MAPKGLNQQYSQYPDMRYQMEGGARQGGSGCRHWSDAAQGPGLILDAGLDTALQGGRLCRLPGERLFPLSGSSILIRTSSRSEEHTSELQSRPHLVCRLLLEKKN